jgi:hypothetical protein
VYYPTVKIDHSQEAIDANQYFAKFFVGESRKNTQKYGGGYTQEIEEIVESKGVLVMLKSYSGLIYAF